MIDKRFKFKIFFNFIMYFSFVFTVLTAFLAFSQKGSGNIALLHVVFGIGFIVFAVWHAVRNRKALGNYFKNANSAKALNTRELLVSMALILVFTLGSIMNFVPFALVNKFLSNQDRDSNFDRISTHADSVGKGIRINLWGGENYLSKKVRFLTLVTISPQIAIWAEDQNGNYIDTLYVTEKAGKAKWMGLPFETVSRPASLPLWSHKRGVKSDNGLYMPTSKNSLPDTVSSATPKGNFTLDTKIESCKDKIVLFMEVNKSFDYNTYYSEQSLEKGNKNHSQMSYSGQPAVVFKATVDLKNDQKLYTMDIVGHSDPAGDSGILYTDISKLDSALKIIDRVIIEIN